MKHIAGEHLLLGITILVLLVGGTLSVLQPPQPQIEVVQPGAAIPLTSAPLAQPADLQGAASGLQGAANVSPNDLNKLNVK